MFQMGKKPMYRCAATKTMACSWQLVSTGGMREKAQGRRGPGLIGHAKEYVFYCFLRNNRLALYIWDLQNQSRNTHTRAHMRFCGLNKIKVSSSCP